MRSDHLSGLRADSAAGVNTLYASMKIIKALLQVFPGFFIDAEERVDYYYIKWL